MGGGFQEGKWEFHSFQGMRCLPKSPHPALAGGLTPHGSPGAAKYFAYCLQSLCSVRAAEGNDGAL